MYLCSIKKQFKIILMLFYRFGDIPEDECSSIWNNNDEVIGKEKGVSVYEAHKNINGELYSCYSISDK